MEGLSKYLQTMGGRLHSAYLIIALLLLSSTGFIELSATDRHPFPDRKYTITASAGPGGRISPSGKVRVEDEEDQTFRISPNDGFAIADVIVDGTSMGPLSRYTFQEVESNHTIEALFTQVRFTIEAKAEKGGEIYPSGDLRVAAGSDQTFLIEAKSDHMILEVLVDGSSVGAVSQYTFENVTADHSIRAYFQKKEVEILGISIPNQTMKIGDDVEATLLVTDDHGELYQLVSGLVGGYPLEDLQRVSNREYRASIRIWEGGNSYSASQEIPVSEVVISNGEMQSPAYEIPIVQDQDPIDASAPRVLSMEVHSGETGAGGVVQLTVRADGAGYRAGESSTINGISIGSSRVSFTDLPDGTYELSYVVAAGDPEVPPGALEATVVLLDNAGNASEAYTVIEENSLEIYTSLPEAVLAGSAEICRGDSARIQLLLTGRSPWSFELTDGESIRLFSGISSPEYEIHVGPLQTTSFEILSVKDVNGVENSGSGSAEITVFEDTPVEILNLEKGYSIESEPVPLVASVEGGTFSGPGVVSATGIFYPEVAGVEGSPHLIEYTYINSSGCESRDIREVYVVESVGAILMPSGTVCSNEEPFEISVWSETKSTGSFRLLNGEGQQVEGLSDLGNNTAIIDPGQLPEDSYSIEYRYFELDTLFLYGAFTLEAVPDPRILTPADSSTLCQNADPVVLRSDPEGVRFEGPGISGDPLSGYIFDPSRADPGESEITATYLSEHGCSSSAVKRIRVALTPEVKFGISTSCIPQEGELVRFENLTADSSSIASWEWDFDDPESGENNHSFLSSPSHFYTEPGPRTITLTAVTGEGCTAAFTLDSVIDSQPVADFTWVTDCFLEESGVSFINRSTVGSASLDSSRWTFRGIGGELLGEIRASSEEDTVQFSFETADRYQVELLTRSSAGCTDLISKEITLVPTLRPGIEGYRESFDEAEGLWSVHSDDPMESWVWGEPDFSGFESVAGDQAWFTRLPEDPQYTEQSWIQSPCFDLSGFSRPMIRLDFMQSFLPGVDGAVLQYRDHPGEEWETLGAETPGINWYNEFQFTSGPGGSNAGWGADEFNPDAEWVTALHDLNQVAGGEHVIFRLAVLLNGKQAVGNQGFALDNLSIGERTKYAVIEYFTDYSSEDSRVADDLVDAIGKKLRRDVIDLQYHLSPDGVDPMYMNNPDISTTRAFNYGVPQVPYMVLDGGSSGAFRYNFNELKGAPVEQQVQLLTLEQPPFDLNLQVDWHYSSLEALAGVECRVERFTDNIQLYTVVFETEVTAYTGRNGDTVFRNVVLDILPTPAGTLLGDNWVSGRSGERTYSWDYASYVEDEMELAVAAFIQDRNTGRILQADVEYRDPTVGIPEHTRAQRDLLIYPNPAQDVIYINLGNRSVQPGSLEIVDLGGKTVMLKSLPAGYQLYQLEPGPLARGAYIVRWREEGRIRGMAKLIISR